jgi:hypothetical protein
MQRLLHLRKVPEPLLLGAIDAGIQKHLLLSGVLIAALAIVIAVPAAFTARAVQHQYNKLAADRIAEDGPSTIRIAAANLAAARTARAAANRAAAAAEAAANSK